MNILITGAAGFIGSNYLHHFYNTKDNFIIVDLLTYAGNINNIKNLLEKKNIFFNKADIADSVKMAEIFNEYPIDIVINFAAESHVDRSFNSPLLFFKTNTYGTGVLLEEGRKHMIKHFHQVSTDEVYGESDYDDKVKKDESSFLNPTSPYASSKAASDLLVLSYYHSYKLNVTISRSSNNYGPYQNKEKLIPLIIDKALKEEKIPIYGKGEEKRDYIYVLDHCLAINKIITEGKIGEIYNISSEKEICNLDLAKYLLKKLNKKEELIEFVNQRKFNDKRYNISSKKIKEELNFTLLTSFEKGIDKTIQFYINENK